jgi:dihydroorotate dehydrogenase (fumarate)
MIGPLRFSQTPLWKEHGIALFNSASPWASTHHDLQSLYDSPQTALVTTRTALLASTDAEGLVWDTEFEENPNVHAHSFLKDYLPTLEGGRLNVARGSLNSYGYSPHSLSQYLEWISKIWQADGERQTWKPFIVSLAGPPEAVEGAIKHIRRWTGEQTGERQGMSSLLAVELNLSCPNIKGDLTPSGYDSQAIAAVGIAARKANAASTESPQLAISLKLPPYTYPAQFAVLIRALESIDIDDQKAHTITFLTCVNTLGGSFWLNPGRTSKEFVKALPALSSHSSGIPTQTYDGTGGLAGESLHPIALGNVYTLHNLLQASSKTNLRGIQILGVGGVMSGLSAIRMKEAGASAVGLATALGREGTSVFERISTEVTLISASDEDRAQ